MSKPYISVVFFLSCIGKRVSQFDHVSCCTIAYKCFFQKVLSSSQISLIIFIFGINDRIVTAQ